MKLLEYLITAVKQGKNPSHANTSLNEQQSIENTSNNQPAIENVSELMVFNIPNKPASDVVTIKCKINKLSIPSAVLDGETNCSIMSLNIAKKLEHDNDTSRPTSLEGVAAKSDTIGAQAKIDFQNQILYVGDSAGLMFNVPISVQEGSKTDQICTECGKKFMYPSGLKCHLNGKKVSCGKHNMNKNIKNKADNTQSYAYLNLTPSSLVQQIHSTVLVRFRYKLPEDFVSTHIRKLPLLREICLRVGVQIAAQGYHFVKKKSKKRATTFLPDDIFNIIPVVKQATPK
ncbi:2476_t:CDS:2 [Entrophospora sp. SA101]|nr:2476_t:CDS:2 [Entrophospora sp. SA101]